MREWGQAETGIAYGMTWAKAGEVNRLLGSGNRGKGLCCSHSPMMSGCHLGYDMLYRALNEAKLACHLL